MESLLIIALLTFFGGMIFQRALPKAKPTQIIYIRAEALDKPIEAKEGLGCLPFLIIGVVLLALLALA